jgi:hypothetical protein
MNWYGQISSGKKHITFMKSRLRIGFLGLWLSVPTYAQFNRDGNCNPGVYLGFPTVPAPFDYSLVRSTLAFAPVDNQGRRQGRCTGALVNQVIGGKPRQLFLTARHCIRSGTNGSGPLVSFDNMQFVFNFQSRNGDNGVIPDETTPFVMSNRGEFNQARFRYGFESSVGLIYESTGLLNSGFGIDIALLEIYRPIPPHFNVYYAGWKTDELLGLNGIANAPMTVLHHPRQDTKKRAATAAVLKLRNPVAVSCRFVTRVIDTIIRIFGGRSMTESVCTWVDIPQYVVPVMTTGRISGGSSGSPFFTNGGRLFGVLSASPEQFGDCNDLAITFGKFQNAYASRQVRDHLNPNYNIIANLTGWHGRDVGCYPDNPLRLSGEYFPARDYQPFNAVEISAEQNIEAGQTDVDQDGNNTSSYIDYNGVGQAVPAQLRLEERRLRVYNGADFTFSAGQRIRLLPGFTADAGSTFTARIKDCGFASFGRQAAPDESGASLLASVVLPTPTEQLEEKPMLKLSPNPTGDDLVCEYWVRQPGAVEVNVFSEEGKAVTKLHEAVDQQPGPYRIERNIRDLEAGVYIVQLKSQNHTESKRLLVSR